ncbi:DNA primase/helicase, phage-associated [Brachybacterium faecium]|nr:DNA primase/helicase, phage-associated [Brachybacterium faecium]
MSDTDLWHAYGSPVPGTVPEPGTDGEAVPVPGFPPMGAEPGTDTRPETLPLYTDIARLLEEGMPDPEAPDMLTRSDGVGLFYRGQVNLVFGDPESGKTWVALAAAAETLRDGGSALVLDLDHNGAKATISRLLMLGAPIATLSDLERFRYVEPEDAHHLTDVVADVIAWQPDVTVLDSIGELIPLFGLSSNSPDDFTMVHGRVMKPLAAKAGTALVAIDHLAKNSESRAQGATGTAAKRRAIGGVSLRVSVSEAFTPGRGGSAALTIHKDRHGGLRAATPGTDREPLAGMFVLSTVDGLTTWSLRAPVEGERAPDQIPEAEDVAAIAALDPAPTTVEEARKRLGWRKTRAAKAMRGWREQGAPSGDSGQVTVPGSRHIGGNREPEPLMCPGCMEPGCAGDCEVPR